MIHLNGVAFNPNQVTCIEVDNECYSYLVRLSDGTVFRHVPFDVLKPFFTALPSSSDQYNGIMSEYFTPKHGDSDKYFFMPKPKGGNSYLKDLNQKIYKYK